MAKRHLMIVESPAKMKTIQQYLNQISLNNPKFKNDHFDILATAGHFMRLTDSHLFQSGYDPQNKKIEFEVDEKKKNVYASLKKVSGYDSVFVATDLDNEGEGIAFHIKNNINKKGYQNLYRIGFDEISYDAINDALNNPIDFDTNKYNAYLYRSVGDKLIGYYGSKRLFADVGNEYSTGRIQADVVLLAGDWETKLKNHIPDFRDRIKLNYLNNSSYVYHNENILETKETLNTTFRVADVKVLDGLYSSKYDVQPYVMNDLVIKYSSKYDQTKIANALQSIKDQGFITYHRTDNPKMDDEFYYKNKKRMGHFINQFDLKLNDYKYLTGSDDEVWLKKQSTKKKELHLAHSGIRIVDLYNPKESLLNGLEKVLYDDIKTQTISFFCAPNKYENVEVKFVDEKNNYATLTFKNYKEINVYKDLDKKTEINKWDELKKLNQQERVNYFLENIQVDVKPKPKVLNDTNFIKELDNIGVGTPSTIHSFIPISRFKQVIDNKTPNLTPKGWTLYHTFKKQQDVYFFADLEYTSDNFEKVIHQIERNEVNVYDALNSMVKLMDTQYDKKQTIDKQKQLDNLVMINQVCKTCNTNFYIKPSSKTPGMIVYCKNANIKNKKGCIYHFIKEDDWKQKYEPKVKILNQKEMQIQNDNVNYQNQNKVIKEVKNEKEEY